MHAENVSNQIKAGDVVVFDVDDTLGFFTKSFDEYMSKRLDMNIPDRDHHPTYDLLSPFHEKLSPETTAFDTLKDFEKTGSISDPERFHPTSVVELVKDLQDRGIMTLALTAREWMDDGHRTTMDWLDSLGISMPVYVLGLKDSKADWINQNIENPFHETATSSRMIVPGDVWVFEDNPHHLKEIYYKSPHVNMPFVVDHPHNRHLLHFDRIDPHSTHWISE